MTYGDLDGLVNINGDSVQTLEIIFLLTLLSLLPSAVILMTSFTRYVVALSFLRTAMGTQQTPPNLILVGLALFLTLFTMGPVIDEINEEAYQPYVREEIGMEEFFETAQVPLKRFMARNTQSPCLRLFCDMARQELPQDPEEVYALPLRVLVPAFATSELEKAFQIGLYLFLPFLMVDIVVSTTLMSMGMIMLPPSMISAPFKILLFLSLDGWELLFSTLVRSYS